MKKIALITLNIPGQQSAISTITNLYALDQQFEITLFSKNNENIENVNVIVFKNIDNILQDLWKNYDALIWFAATGIVIRKLAPLLESKSTDPAVLVMNLDRTQIIPLISGHLGRANELAKLLESMIPDLTTFVTTATDSLGLFAFDLFSQKYGFDIVNLPRLAKVSNSIVNSSQISVITYKAIQDLLVNEGLNGNNISFYNIEDSQDLVNFEDPSVLIAPCITDADQESSLCVRIKPISIGIGLNRNTEFSELLGDFYSFLTTNNINIEHIYTIASFEAKTDEKALLKLADSLNLDLNFYNKEDINNLENDFSYSKAENIFFIKGVAEPTAVLASQFKTLFIKKVVYTNTTFAAAF